MIQNMADRTVPGPDGLIWYSTPHATVGLVVRAAVVVDCAPYARRWALGRDARQLWDAAKRRGIDLAWLPEMHPPVSDGTASRGPATS